MDIYTILGIKKNAKKKEIKDAYKKLALKHHPDRGGNQGDFVRITRAYNTALKRLNGDYTVEYEDAVIESYRGTFYYDFNDGENHEYFIKNTMPSMNDAFDIYR